MSESTGFQRSREESPSRGSKEIVLAFIDALNRSDFDSARKLVADDMKFVGVLGSRDGGDAYFRDMKHMNLKYDVKKAFADGDDVCLFYDVTIAGVTVLCAGWYQLSNGKIHLFRVIFDPRALLEAAEKNK